VNELDLYVGKAVLAQVIIESFKLLFRHHAWHKPKVYFDHCLRRQYRFCTFADVAGVKAGYVAGRHSDERLFYVSALCIGNKLADTILFFELFHVKGLTCND
jgi:hypothetical protein